MSDTSDNEILRQAYESDQFQQRCYLRYRVAAIAVSNESSSVTSHTQRLALAGALFNGTVPGQMLAQVILASSINRLACLADPTFPGGQCTDANIDSQVTSTFTGIAISRSW